MHHDKTRPNSSVRHEYSIIFNIFIKYFIQQLFYTAILRKWTLVYEIFTAGFCQMQCHSASAFTSDYRWYFNSLVRKINHTTENDLKQYTIYYT